MDNRPLLNNVRRFEHFCSTDVRRLFETVEQLHPSIINGYRQNLTGRSICSTFLYPTGHLELLLRTKSTIGRIFPYLRWGQKVSNKSNRIENILSIPYIYWLSAVRPNRTSVEHPSNTVRWSVEQIDERSHFFLSRLSGLFDGALGQVRLCSTVHRTARSHTQQPIAPVFAGLFDLFDGFAPHRTYQKVKMMTRLPETPVQTADKARHLYLVNYLMKLSEERQVSFMKNLQSNKLKMEVSRDLERMKAARNKLIPPRDKSRYQSK